MTRAQLLAGLLAVGIALWVIDLVRRRRLSEEYSLLALLAMAGVILVAFWTRGLTWFTHWFGALYETSIIFFFGLLFVMMALLFYATKLTALHQQSRRLTQEVAILRLRLEEAERRAAAPAPGGAGPGGGPGAGLAGRAEAS